jgi:hypothetical protein
MKTLILFSSASTFRPLSVIASLAADQKCAGHDVTVLDISGFSYVSQDLPPRWFARLCGQDVFPGALERVLATEGISLRILSPRARAARLPDGVAEQFDEGVFSELVTYLRTDSPQMNRWFHRYTERKIRQRAAPLFDSLTALLRESDFERVILPNGRVAHLRLALMACTVSKVPVEYFEIGRALENSYYLGTQQIHDREGTQAEVTTVTAHLSDARVADIAHQWLTTRMTTGLAIHPYNTDWSEAADTPASNINEPLAVFFTSSVDEFTSYGGSWQAHTWADQYEAFNAIVRLLHARGVRCVLRVHPNLRNKSREFVQRELRRVEEIAKQHPQLVVLFHTDPTSSYDLLKAADYVIVGRSTLGLEGSCLGKCVWTTTAARYDAIADVRPILRAEDATSEAFARWTANPLGAQRFVAYWVLQDHLFRFGENLWATWDSLRPPLPMRIGNLLLKNSWAHRFHLVRLEWVKMLNRARGRQMAPFPKVTRRRPTRP